MRFPRLAALLAKPRVRRVLGVFGWAAVGLYFMFGLLVVVLQQFVLPAVGEHRSDIERELSVALGQPVVIEAIDARWHRLWPRLRIHGLQIRDNEGRTALGLDEVEADIAWSSLWHMAPHFARLAILAPHLDIRRDASGRVFVAGLEVKPDESSSPGFMDWLLAQDRIVIRDAALSWRDELRQAPELALTNVNFDLHNGFRRHRFGLTAEPPKALAARLDIRGDFRGRDLEAAIENKGQVYAELDYADLSGWHPWVDYPVQLPHGVGALRLWLNVERKALAGFTADVRLGRTIVRLAPDLPMLDLDRLEGRLAGSRLEQGLKVQARKLELATHNGIEVGPTDFDVRWQPASESSPADGEASATELDVGALAALSAYLPFEASVRQQLIEFNPKGRLHELQMNWTSAPSGPVFHVKARFEDLGLKASGLIPGFSGLDGRMDANQKGGSLELATRQGTVELPAVFETPVVQLGQLDASATWQYRDGKLDVRLAKAAFLNDDAAGEASGRYRYDGKGPGEIDLSAKLTRANGGMVWRYMPLVVNADVRNWLHDSIDGGNATATLRLKGDLEHFPFSDGLGIFEVKGRFQNAALNYAPGWPGFVNVDGALSFVGARMSIQAQKARLWNIALADVTAEADLGAAEAPLVVMGSAKGPTADFLRFITESPVSGFIGNATNGMKATGSGELKLRLDLPLHALETTKVDGRYRFADNQLTYLEALPPINAMSGELRFTDASLEARKIRGTMLGAPVAADIATKEGVIALNAAGTLNTVALRQYYGQPLLDYLSGSAPLTGTVRVGKGAAEIRVESSLQGISSSLPEPFNKTARDALPVAFIFQPVNGVHQFDVTMGDAVRAQARSRSEPGKPNRIDQGFIAIRRPDAKLPDRGLLLALGGARVDVDQWRRLLGAGKTGGPGLPIDRVDVRAEELRAFERSMHALQLSGVADGDTWRFDVTSREAAGRVAWTSRPDGDRLSGRLERFDLVENGNGNGAVSQDTERTERLPAIDLLVDHFLLHGRELGELRLFAENAAGMWTTGFQIHSADGDLAGTGRWKTPQPGVLTATELDFSLKANSIERMLGRLGYPDALRRGSATFGGALAWMGAPTQIDYNTLRGKLTVDAEDGQFKKLEPGVGRLLGILSLQSLPRRISLDFRDIFSEGFAFDSITGNADIAQGIMVTSDLQIDGPAATVFMNGKVDLARETQDLKVRVQPTIGETVATGVLLINPVMGATAWLMNKMFGNPLDKVFAFDYAITGSWEDPKVDKVAVQGPGIGQPGGNTVAP